VHPLQLDAGVRGGELLVRFGVIAVPTGLPGGDFSDVGVLVRDASTKALAEASMATLGGSEQASAISLAFAIPSKMRFLGELGECLRVRAASRALEQYARLQHLAGGTLAFWISVSEPFTLIGAEPDGVLLYGRLFRGLAGEIGSEIDREINDVGH
jgi:hypothetical protein